MSLPVSATLSVTGRETWRRQGYLPVPKMFSHTAIDEVEHLVNGLLAERMAGGADDWTQLRSDGKATSIEILATLERQPLLKATEVYRHCEVFAAELLQRPMECVFDHIIHKTAGIGTGTYWHQDSYYEKEEPYRNTHRVHFWIPMADVPLMGGAMRYIPGTHGGHKYVHKSIPGREHSHYVMATGFDESAAVDVPIDRGGVIVHHPHLLHASGPNQSQRPRTAWILQFAAPRTLMQKVRYRSRGWLHQMSGKLIPAAD